MEKLTDFWHFYFKFFVLVFIKAKNKGMVHLFSLYI